MIYLFFYNSQKLSPRQNNIQQREYAEKLLQKMMQEEFAIQIKPSDIAKGKFGKPYFRYYPVFYNISHCDGAICLVLGKTELGVDIERADRNALSAAKRVCDPAEQQDIKTSKNPELRFIQYWTLKESYVKYLGRGIGYGLKNIVFDLKSDEPLLKKPKQFPKKTIFFQQKQIEKNQLSYVLSVCGEEIPMPVKIISQL